MSAKWDLIYELRADHERVRHLQEAIERGDDFSTMPYLFGSRGWWNAIEAGSIECHRIEGTITETKPTRLPDLQQFHMMTPDGSELTGVRHGDPTRYVEGLHLRFDYVTLERAPDAPPELGTTAEVVIAVWVEHSHKRTPYVHSVLPPFPWPIDFDREKP